MSSSHLSGLTTGVSSDTSESDKKMEQKSIHHVVTNNGTKNVQCLTLLDD